MTLRRTLLILFLTFAVGTALAGMENYGVAPRVTAALDQGLAAERGIGIHKNIPLAISLYCDAGRMGSPEGFFRIGRILSKGPVSVRDPRMANAFLALAARLGHQQGAALFNDRVTAAPMGDECNLFADRMVTDRFDMDSYIARQPQAKRQIASLIRSKAPQYNVNARLALGIALAESNLNAQAVSPKNAQGVMQLIPDTQERFGVKNAFHPEQNVRGGLAYLKWLQKRFNGDWKLVAAAYNAGEGAVDHYGGIPPFPETQQYVRRVLYFSGYSSAK